MNGEEYLNYKNNWASDDETDEDAALTDFEKRFMRAVHIKIGHGKIYW